MSIRERIFWLLDLLKGRRTVKVYNEIQSELDSGIFGHEKKVENILNHCKLKIPFYKSISSKMLSDFPIVNKSIVKENMDSFVRDDIDTKNFYKAITSGSTGTPFAVYHDKEKRIRNYADNIVFSRLAGYEIGNKLFYLKIWPKKRMYFPLYYWAQNVVPVDVTKLTADKIDNLLKSIQASKNASIIGYVSAFEQVLRHINSHNYTHNTGKLLSAITISEALNDFTIKELNKYFNVQAISRYSNLENGIIAQQTKTSEGRFLVNTSSYLVEIVDENGKNVENGISGRIVVTDLFNKAMPLVRYDTGDYGSLTSTRDDKGLIYLEKIDGRKLDLIFDTSGNQVSSYIMYNNMWQYEEIDQYQLIQMDQKEYMIKILLSKSTDEFKREEKLRNEYLEILGVDADFKVEYVSEIPLLNSGKRRKLVNLMVQK